MPNNLRLVKCLFASLLLLLTPTAKADTLRVATFNVSMEATNYMSFDEIAENPERRKIVQEYLASGETQQMKNVAEIIQRIRPDILLLNEFDYVSDPSKGILAFTKNYLNVSQNLQAAIDYPYHFIAPVNTGIATPFDLDNNGKKTGNEGDAFGFGFYAGQWGMAILSKYPIDLDSVRTFQTFIWKDMPDALRPSNPDGSAWYLEEEWNAYRLSSKSHWDVPVQTESGVVHIIAAHPTPPVFDGPADSNGTRNHDEIRLLSDYISNQSYIYDDNRVTGGLLPQSRFVIAGDFNSSPVEGDSIRASIQALLANPLVDASCTPSSKGGQMNKPESEFSATHTADFGLRVDYALPSKHGLKLTKCGMFWPAKNDPLHSLVSDRRASSDHRLVWIDLEVE